MRLSLTITALFIPLLALAQDAPPPSPPEAPTTKTLTSTLTRTFTVSTIASVTATRISGIPYPSDVPNINPSNSTAPFYTATAPMYLPTGGNTGGARFGPPTTSGKASPTNFPKNSADILGQDRLIIGVSGLLMIYSLF
ncbi:hypothetical protein K3495_g9744 [Podosphaera aphanis]|nr:hypothetical protein K3495_g9744 [Podosphaera aphanis]